MSHRELFGVTSNETEVLEVEEREWTAHDLPFYGQTVMMNPERTGSRAGQEGIVISMQGSERNIMQVLKKPENYVRRWNVAVKWEDGETDVVEVQNLLLIDKPFKPIIYIYTFQGGEHVYIEGDKDTERHVTSRIIKRREIIDKTERYDEEFREKMLQAKGSTPL